MPVGIEYTKLKQEEKMKKLLVVLLSLGLIAAFSMTASAADVKFGGSYYVVGVYGNHPQVYDPGSGNAYDYSHAFFYQRVRLQPVFQIAEGLTFTARMDALEKQWGNTNWKGSTNIAGIAGPDDLSLSRPTTGAQTPKRGTQENIEFERGYVTFLTGIGQFQVGYQNVDDWGTDFGDYSNSRPRIQFATKVGNLILAAAYEKVYENDTAVVGTSTPTGGNNLADADKDTYAISGTYKDKNVEAGLLYKFYAYNNYRQFGIKQAMSQLSPYAKVTAGPFYFEGEATYWYGKFAKFEEPNSMYPAGTADIDLNAMSLYLKGKMNAGPAYFGALFSYASGNDLSDKTKFTTALSGGGTNFAPALLLLNDAMATWTGSGSAAASPGNYTSSLGFTGTIYNPVTSSKYNTIIYNAFAGFNPDPKLNVEAALTYATVDKKAISMVWATGKVTEAVSDKLGTEFDVKATYKIYDNLTYMLGAGYLWTGDYFKGASATATVANDYVLMNQLTLSF